MLKESTIKRIKQSTLTISKYCDTVTNAKKQH